MIVEEQLTAVGQVKKSHGLSGEFTIDFTVDFDIDECPFLIFDIDGIFVPFEILDYRYYSNTCAYITLNGINNEVKARQLYGFTVFVDTDKLGDVEVHDSNSLSVLLQFEVCDVKLGVLGKITHVDESTDNVLIEIDNERLIPAAFIQWDKVDMEDKKLLVNIPEELWDINI